MEQEQIETMMTAFTHLLKSPEIDKFDRAKVIEAYILSNGLSQRQFAKKYNIHHSTLQDWLRILKITKEQESELRKKGLNNKNIYRLLRDNNKSNILEFSETDLQIEKTTQVLLQSPIQITKYTKEKIDRLEKALSRFKFKFEQTLKGEK
jgi:transposase